MKEIVLTNGMVAFVDDEYFEELNNHRWCCHNGKNTHYAIRYERGRRGERIFMHRFIMGTPIGDKTIIDHIDGNGLNNQKQNLRWCTQKQNSMNCCSHSDSTSKYKGVSWSSKYKKWRSEIYHNGKGIYLGMFESEIDAAIAYDKKSNELFGEWGKPNFK